MHTALHEVAVPEAHDLSEFPAFLEQMTSQELPAFVVHEAGLSLLAILDSLRPILSDQEYWITTDIPAAELEVRRHVFPAGLELSPEDELNYPDAGSDVGYHFDHHPKTDRLILTTHLTTVGAGKVSLVEPLPLFFQETIATDSKPDVELLNQLQSGCTDDEYFVPQLHSAELRAGSLLVFRLAGLVPLVHDFRTTQAPRGAEITDLTRSNPIS